jgi:hypothetical protein
VKNRVSPENGLVPSGFVSRRARPAIPKNLFVDILRLIADLRPPPNAALA